MPKMLREGRPNCSDGLEIRDPGHLLSGVGNLLADPGHLLSGVGNLLADRGHLLSGVGNLLADRGHPLSGWGRAFLTGVPINETTGL